VQAALKKKLEIPSFHARKTRARRQSLRVIGNQLVIAIPIVSRFALSVSQEGAMFDMAKDERNYLNSR